MSERLDKTGLKKTDIGMFCNVRVSEPLPGIINKGYESSSACQQAGQKMVCQDTESRPNTAESPNCMCTDVILNHCLLVHSGRRWLEFTAGYPGNVTNQVERTAGVQHVLLNSPCSPLVDVPFGWCRIVPLATHIKHNSFFCFQHHPLNNCQWTPATCYYKSQIVI